MHAHRQRRRRRDNLIALAGVLLVVGLAAATQIAYFSSGPGAPQAEPSASPSPSPSAEPEGENVGDIPDPALAEGRTWTGELVLNDVSLAIELDGAAAPQAVAAFVQQVNDGYFTGKSCHRLTDEGARLIQCGSLDGTGMGDPDYRFGPLENTPADNVYPAGTIALARAAGDAYSQGHQFFITYDDATIGSDAAGGYTVFGRVTGGLEDFIERIASAGVAEGRSPDGPPAVPTTITSVTVQ